MLDVISAPIISDFQACSRKYVLNHHWRPTRWHHRSLFNSCLRQAIFEMSNGKKLDDVISEARTRYLNTAANPGLDIGDKGGDPYIIAMDYCSCLSTILCALHRKGMMALSNIPSKKLNDELEWVFNSFQDESGVLWRIIICDHFDDERMTQEMHSWYSWGDQCFAFVPMKFLIIEIGQMRNGRRESPWCRGFSHPYIHGRIKFTRKDAKELQGNWNKIYLADSSAYTHEPWVDLMEEEGLVNVLIKDNVELSQPRYEHVIDTRRQVTTLAEQIRMWNGVESYRLVPMSRGACDGVVPCPFRAVCYSPTALVNIEGLGIYKERPRTTFAY